LSKRAGSRATAARGAWPLLALLGLAAANFGWQLGSSSYFVDEVLSLQVSLEPLGGVLHAASTSEVTPPLYFYFMHEWIGRIGTIAEWATRLPSVLAGIALVAAVWWLARLLSERRVLAAVAAGLTALSPLALQYAQMAQGYVFVMLAVTLAAAASLRARQPGQHRGRWLAAAAIAAVFALWLHYTAVLLVIPLCIWIARATDLPTRWRCAFIGVCIAAEATVVPMMIAQHNSFPNRPGVAGTAALTLTTAERVFELPFDGRVDPLRLLGLAVTLAALLTLAVRRTQLLRNWRLVGVLAIGPPLALLLLSAVERSGFLGHLMLARYAIGSAPFVTVVIAAAVTSIEWRAFGAVLGIAALTVAVTGVVLSHRRTGFYLDARDVAQYVNAREHPGDVELAPGNQGELVPLGYYGLRYDPSGTADGPTLVATRRHRLWVIAQLPTNSVSTATLRRAMRLPGFTTTDVHVFQSLNPMGVVLEVPIPMRDLKTATAKHARI
jgi:mannosyltransferase